MTFERYRSRRPARPEVDLAVTEHTVGLHRLDGQHAVGEVDLGPLRDLHVLQAAAGDGLDPQRRKYLPITRALLKCVTGVNVHSTDTLQLQVREGSPSTGNAALVEARCHALTSLHVTGVPDRPVMTIPTTAGPMSPCHQEHGDECREKQCEHAD